MTSRLVQAVINTSLEEGTFPGSFKEALVHPLLKTITGSLLPGQLSSSFQLPLFREGCGKGNGLATSEDPG